MVIFTRFPNNIYLVHRNVTTLPIVVAQVKDNQGAYGYNAQTDEYEDLISAGVIDPTKVVRSALQNASSIASLLLTTEALVSEIPEEKKEAAMPGGHGGGMGGMY